MSDIVWWLRKEAELIALPRLSEAAAAIERLQASNAELVAALENFERLRERNAVLETAHRQTRKTLDEAYVEIERLRTSNTELMVALEEILRLAAPIAHGPISLAARAAIAKAEGKS